MSVFTPCTWNMGAVQLVSTTTSQLSTLNSIQAAFIASTYWEQESTGTSSLGYKYIVVRPKSSLNSIYRDYRIFFCERVNFTTGRIIGDGTAVASRFNTTTNVMAYFCPDGGALTFTAANIESGDIWPGTNYKSSSSTVWHSVAVACTAVWIYEADGISWLVSRQAASSHSLMGLGNIMYVAKDTYVDYNSSSVEIGPAGAYTATAITNATAFTSQLFNGTTKCQFFWWKPTGSSTRTAQTMSGATNISGSPQPFISGLTLTGLYDTTAGTTAFNPIYMIVSGASTAGTTAFRGVYWCGAFKTRTTIQKSSSTIGYTWYADDSVATNGLAFMNT